jgi:1-deoxy-D-xylulose-5-phosphate synthase
VGIAEENAVGIISGIAKNGGKPVFGTGASFIQRTYDQISQDLCINNNSATIVLGFTSVWGLNDVTHLGIFTISAFSHIPNLLILAPTNKQEYISMLDWAVEQNEHPVMIIMPGNGVIDDNRVGITNYSKEINKFKIEQSGEKVAIIAAGDFYQIGEETAKIIENKLGFKPTLINPRFVNDIDRECLEKLKKNHSLVITLEDGIVDGGFGQKVSSYFGLSDIKVKNYGLDKEFYDRFDAKELLKNLGITPNQICEVVKNYI